MDPLQYAVYKGFGGSFGAIQFNLQLPHYYNGNRKDYKGQIGEEENKAFAMLNGKRTLKNGWKSREGAIFVQIASAKDKNVYDWDNKVVMALSINDMGKILLSLLTGEECSIMHDPGAKTDSQGAVKKYLTVSSPKGVAVGVVFSLTQMIGKDKRSHTVPLSGDEVVTLKVLLEKAIASSLAW